MKWGYGTMLDTGTPCAMSGKVCVSVCVCLCVCLSGGLRHDPTTRHAACVINPSLPWLRCFLSGVKGHIFVFPLSAELCCVIRESLLSNSLKLLRQFGLFTSSVLSSCEIIIIAQI